MIRFSEPQTLRTGLFAPLFILSALFLSGCSERTLLQAWLGEGEFTIRGRSLDVKAQLEILEDGTYRYLILEPGIIAMMGMETGTWQENGSDLDLSPNQGSTEAGGILGSTPRDFNPKTLSIEGNYSRLILDDGAMQITFKPNPEATKKLRANGEVP